MKKVFADRTVVELSDLVFDSNIQAFLKIGFF